MIVLEIVLKMIALGIGMSITYYVVPYLKSKNIYNETLMLVKAAEQIFVGSKRGQEKYQYVVTALAERFHINKEDLENIIESAVFEIKKGSN